MGVKMARCSISLKQGVDRYHADRTERTMSWHAPFAAFHQLWLLVNQTVTPELTNNEWILKRMKINLRYFYIEIVMLCNGILFYK